MSLLDFLKRKKEKKEIKESPPVAREAKETKVVKESPPVSEEIKEIKEKKEVKKEKYKVLKKKADKKFNSFIIQAPHITEKATDLQTKNQYTFRVLSDSNKTEIKKTIEQLYDVDVLSVKIIKVPRKRRRVGKVSGWRKGYKKAIIRVGKGQKIEELTV